MIFRNRLQPIDWCAIYAIRTRRHFDARRAAEGRTLPATFTRTTCNAYSACRREKIARRGQQMSAEIGWFFAVLAVVVLVVALLTGRSPTTP